MLEQRGHRVGLYGLDGLYERRNGQLAQGHAHLSGGHAGITLIVLGVIGVPVDGRPDRRQMAEPPAARLGFAMVMYEGVGSPSEPAAVKLLLNPSI